MLGLCIIWDLLSSGQAIKLIGLRKGLAFCILFSILSAVVLLVLERRPEWGGSLSVAAALAGCWLLVAAAYFVLHPMSQRHVFGPGSDRENAIQVASHALFSGHFPYRELTFLHHPITPMPGALLLASPFYLIGQVGLQNLLWLAIFLYWIYRFIGRSWIEVWYVYVFVLLSPCIMQDFVTGGEFFTNLVYVIVILTAVFRSLKKDQAGWSVWMWPLLLGIALASRPIYSLVYPCLFAYALQSSNRWVAIRTVGLTLIAEFCVILPVYFRDPTHFMPFNAGSNAYSLLPAWLHPAILTFASGFLTASTSFFVHLNLRRVLLILGCALTLVTLPFFIVDRVVNPDLFPLMNLIYLSPGLLLIGIWLLYVPASARAESDLVT
jgi:hypothetical protein